VLLLYICSRKAFFTFKKQTAKGVPKIRHVTIFQRLFPCVSNATGRKRKPFLLLFTVHSLLAAVPVDF